MLFLSMLTTRHDGLLRLGELTIPDSVALRNSRKITLRQFSFFLPYHKADRFYDGNSFAACPQAKCSLAVSTQSLCMLPRLANHVAVPFFPPPTGLYPRDLEIAEAEERMAECLMHIEAMAQDTL
ncbi:hypothetical protein B0H14DRAFT_3499892 [Mycena olivaceomarginata]|nr:hypothetical protein B0H14DRAFT_3499892 [Mycena olivaceomarginata]